MKEKYDFMAASKGLERLLEDRGKTLFTQRIFSQMILVNNRTDLNVRKMYEQGAADLLYLESLLEYEEEVKK